MKIFLTFLVGLFFVGLVIFYWLQIRRSVTASGPLHVIAGQFPSDYFVGDPTKSTLNYVVLGDSTAYGVGATKLEATYPYAVAATLASSGYYVHVRNIGRSGALLEEIVHTQFDRVSKNTDIISISVGGNDATHVTSPSTYRMLINELTEKLKASGAPVILVASTTDMALTPAIPPVLNTIVGMWARRQNHEMQPAIERIGAAYVNLFEFGKLDKPELYASDEFHPSDAGYAKWSPLFQAALKSQLHKIANK